MNLLPIDAVAFELWTISDSIAFDNVLLTNDVDVANYVVDHTYQLKKDLADEESDNLLVKLIKSTNKKPWLWAVYLLIIAVPVIAFIAYCCVEPVSKRSQESMDEQITARRKKTDEVTPDVSTSSPPKVSKESTPTLVRESTPNVSRISPSREEIDEVEPEEEGEEEPATEEEELVEEEVEGEELVPNSGSGEEVAAEVEEVVQEQEPEEEVEVEEEEPEPTSSKKGKARRRKKSAGRS